MGVNMLDVKQVNAEVVLWELWALRTASVKELSQRTGLSFATVASILSGFVETGEVVLGGRLSGTGGRPSQAYVFNAEFAHILALSAQVRNGTHLIRSSVGTLYGETIATNEKSFDQIELISFETMVDAALQAHPKIKVAAFALPGVVRAGRVLVNDYPALEGIDFPGHFRERYGLLGVAGNDVNAALAGYAVNSEPAPVVAALYFPRQFNPGAAVMVDGKIVEGALGYAGEVSLLPIDVDWKRIDYYRPQEIGPALARLVAVFCAIVNPSRVVLYGDFFTEETRRAVTQNIPSSGVNRIFPELVYDRDLDRDIIAGLFSQAIAAYKQHHRTKQ
ncbi:MAG: ROK family protein [Firmicutes bacterium]|nr:ROK family protein [Bacillota bacterium]